MQLTLAICLQTRLLILMLIMVNPVLYLAKTDAPLLAFALILIMQ